MQGKSSPGPLQPQALQLQFHRAVLPQTALGSHMIVLLLEIITHVVFIVAGAKFNATRRMAMGDMT